ncbi:hypothetical protein QBC46DRAFT_432724, partial [Diplogelasinospora grovesii]
APGSSSLTVSTITFPAIKTTAIPVYNLNITQNIDCVTYTVTPSLFCVAPITVGPPGPASTITSSQITYYISTTPSGSSTQPIVTSTKTKVSFTSTSSTTPTCTAGCGKECVGDNCSDCNGSGCSCSGCCSGCTGGGGGSGGGKNPGGCIGSACPPGTGPPTGSDGGSGGGGGDDGSSTCSSSTTVVDTTVYCILSASPGSSTMETTCTSTEYETSTGCDIEATSTTEYESEACPTLAAYTPIWSVYTADLPTAGDDGWGGYVYTTGTYVGGTTTSPTPTTSTPTTPAPQTTITVTADVYYFWYWQCESNNLITDAYRVGKAADGLCGSRDNKVSGNPDEGLT